MKRKLHLTLLLLLAFVAQVTYAQAPVATPKEAVTALLNRIGGDGAADKFVIVIDASLAENGQDVFVITSQDGKPCIKGNTQLSVTTGINWYLNHHAHINLTWNQLTTDLSKATLPVPSGEEKHVCNATYRYNFNTCTFSYSMAFWTWERWQQEIDWMALHGINAPLNLVGLDVVTRKFLRELGVSEKDINAYIAGPGFIAWFAMNNLEGWGGTINATDVTMNGNPDWWYTRQEQLCRNMLQRMRELGMQPVIPGFSGQVPNCIVNYSINGFSSGDVVNNGTWAGGYTRPDILKPNTESYRTFAAVYYKHLHEVMGVSELYSIDPFHEGSLPSGVSNETCYPNIMAELDNYYNGVSTDDKTKFFVDEQPKWMIQYWQGVPQSGAFSAMSSYGDRFIGLDLFADNIYADNAAKWRTGYYNGRPHIYCMLHNFGGRSGLHGRLETTLNGYFDAMAKNNNCQGIGATPEGTETNPILYDMLFELPWMNSKPTADEWLEDYAHARYGTENEQTLEAMKLLKKSVWDCKVNQQGTSEAIILARPNWTVNSVSSWSTSAIYWDTQDVLMAADLLISAEEVIQSIEGKENYNYDVMDVIRQAMVDYAAELLPLINAARGNNDEYTRLYQLYLQLMLDLDEMLSYNENFKLERWTSLARNIANEVSGTTENDRNWLEWNARTQITVWSKGNTDLHDYSNRCWAGLIKDFHYKRWKKFFETNGGSFDGGWYSGFEYPWTVDFTNYNYSTVTIPNDMTATAKAKQTFGKYFGRVKGNNGKNYIFPMGVATKATKSDVIPEVYRGQTVDLPLEIGKNDVTITSVWIDLNNDGAKGNGETLPVANGQVEIPADATIGKTTAQVVYSDGTDITFNLALVEDIADARTVTAVAGANGSVAIEGTNELSVTNTKAVKMTATANTGYNFKDWTDAAGNVVSNDNPYIYYGKEAATFTANFIQDKWGVPTEDKSDWGDATVKTSFVNQLTFAYYNREPETIYEATVAPDNLFNTIPQIINVPQGASFDVTWSDDSNNGLKYCCLSAYIDLNADGDFTDEGELLKVAGTKGAQSTTACEGKINVILPYDAPLGLTHMRIRFDGAWKDNGYNATTKSYDAKAQLNRMCYEIVINVTEKSDKAATINVETNSKDWGTVEVWTDETPDGSTGTKWVVSANIPMYLRATKASEDVEFLGWYDHYGRLLTNELEYTMYAREDATYTAKFRKFLEIDGWNIEYRTEPGSEVVTAKLANGVKPEAGTTYYIYAPTRPTNNGEYVNRYLYNNSGTLTLSTIESTAANYLWVCGEENGKYTFQNVADPTKYLKHKGLANTPYGFELGTGTTYYEGITLQSVPGDGETRNLFFVINDDGSGFNHSEKTHNQSTENYTTDFVFTEVSTPDVVILTNVRKSGNHDLVIPETVEILGEQCKIVGFDNNLFKNNKDLWTISLPSTIEEMSNNKVFTGVVKGRGANASANAANYITTDLGTTLAAGEDWSISLTIEDNGNNFNQWGSALIATGNAPMNSTYGKGFQLYMQAGGGLVVKTDADSDAHKLTNLTKGSKYRIDIVYTHANTQLKVTATPLTSVTALTAARRTKAAREAGSLTIIQDMSDFSVVSHAIPEGVNITKLEVRKGTEPDPFEGCTNLLGVTVADGCEGYFVADGTLYTAGGTNLHKLADAKKEEEIRALGTLIDNTKALMDVIATEIDPVGKSIALPLSTKQGDKFYVSTNADQNTGGGNQDGAGIAGLVDNNESTYFHSRWGGTAVNAPHHIMIDLGEGNEMSVFQFSYVAHNAPDPTAFDISGSNDGEDFNPIDDAITKEVIAVGSTYTSKVFEASESYRYLLIEVTNSERSGYGASFGSYKCFGMKEFDLFKLTSLVEVAPVYKNLAGITNNEASEVYDNLVKALYLYNNGGTEEELQAAYDALNPLYTALNKKKNKVLNGVYHIKFGGAPIFVAHSQALDGLTGAGNPGYRLFDATTTNTNSSNNNKRLQDEAIAAKAAGDELFTIVPNSDITGYTISAQGLYMQTTGVPSQWSVQYFDTDEAKAGVYLIEDVSEDVFKLKSNKSGTQYVNDWGPVFGNDNSNKAGLSTFSFSPVTEYTLTVPTSGVTTLCLPFNVVLPEGVTAYEVNLDKKKNYTGYTLEIVASAGETLAKNTPVIIKATADDYTLTITMDEEDAKHATENNLLRSGLIKTTVAPADTKYAFDGENFNVMTVDTEVPANQCWMELSENCGPVIYGSTPVYILTTDEANPILYKIIIKRANDGSKVLQYDETSKMVAVANKTDNSSWQAWYFMGDANGITIHPYNADGKKLGATNTSNGAGKVSAVDEATYDRWTFLKQGDNGYFNLRTASNGAYFSNYGGDTNKMGFWDGDNDENKTQNDGGSLFKIEEVAFENDNPRFYQLSDVRAALTDGADIPSGTGVGLYSNVEAYRTACTTASSLISAGNTSSSKDCYDAYTALRNTKAEITYNEPDENKYYVIKSVSNETYCKDKLVRTSYEPAEHDGSGDTKYDHRHLVFDAADAIPQPSLAVFQFKKTGTTGEYRMKNLHTGLYVKSFTQDTEHMGAEADAEPVAISGFADGAVTLRVGNSAPMHAQDTHDVIVTYGAEPGNASLWSIEETTGIKYQASISSVGYSTLYLNYPVSIPNGVIAYEVGTIQDNMLIMQKVENTIPARTGVVLRGDAGTYKFALAETTNSNRLTAILSGTLYKQTMDKEIGSKYYVLSYVDTTDDNVRNPEVGFYQAVLGDNSTRFSNAANKAYLQVSETNGEAREAFLAFNFDYDDVETDIAETEDGYAEGEKPVIFDLQGRRVLNPRKPGMYIVNGKKIMLK